MTRYNESIAAHICDNGLKYGSSMDCNCFPKGRDLTLFEVIKQYNENNLSKSVNNINIAYVLKLEKKHDYTIKVLKKLKEIAESGKSERAKKDLTNLFNEIDLIIENEQSV